MNAPKDEPAVVIPRDRAVRALVVSLAARVQVEHRSFVRGDMCVREHDAERLLGLKPGTFKARRRYGKLTYTVRREANHSWFNLFEIAAAMLDGQDGKDGKTG